MSTPPGQHTAPSGSHRSGRRSSERERKPTKSRSHTPTVKPYPHGPPTTTEEKLFSSLDVARFSGRPLVAADDILVPVFNDLRNGLRIRTIGEDELAPQDSRLLKESFRTALAAKIDPEYPTWQVDALTKRLQSHKIVASEDSAADAFKNLALRYSRLRNSPRVLVSHITMNHKVEARIVAKASIPKGTLILELGGLMSCDTVVTSEPTDSSTRPRRRRTTSAFKSISVIKRTHEQGGPIPRDRFLLGPMRFINHACAPNCKLVPFPKTLALGIQTIEDVYEGDEVTLNYGAEYFSPGTCACARCTPKVEESDVPESSLVPPSRKRRFIDDDVQVDSDEEISSKDAPSRKRRFIDLDAQVDSDEEISSEDAPSRKRRFIDIDAQVDSDEERSSEDTRPKKKLRSKSAPF